jgi:peptide/nickel transport system permease protein
VAGYRGGRLGWLLTRIVDIGLALPGLLVVLLVLAFLGPSEQLVIIVLSLESSLSFARLARALAAGLKTEGYIEAAELGGIRSSAIIFRHVLPNSLPPMLTLATLEFARVVLQEASLSYLGYGIQPPAVSWGLMVADGQEYIAIAWWLVFMPGFALAVTVLAVNRLEAWLQQSSDPATFANLPNLRRPFLGTRGGGVPPVRPGAPELEETA